MFHWIPRGLSLHHDHQAEGGADVSTSVSGNSNLIRCADALLPAEPLHKRAPGRDESGKPYGDFMMIIPGLRTKPAHLIEQTINELNLVLSQFSHAVVFADLNLKINLLWITVRPSRDIGLAIASTVRLHVPEAKLVAANFKYV